jgi:ParB family chromosome partitioning protein
MGHARCLAGISDPERQLELAKSVVETQTSVRALEAAIREEKQIPRGSAPAKKKGGRTIAPSHVTQMERRFEEALKTKVHIKQGKRPGRGRIVIDYFSLDDFERIAGTLGLELSEIDD